MLEVSFYSARPKSHYKTGKNAGLLREDAPVMNAHKPDVDNLLKFVMDAMNGVFYKDDGQIVTIIVNKFYSPNPRTEIGISEL